MTRDTVFIGGALAAFAVYLATAGAYESKSNLWRMALIALAMLMGGMAALLLIAP